MTKINTPATKAANTSNVWRDISNLLWLKSHLRFDFFALRPLVKRWEKRTLSKSNLVSNVKR
jgi:hypothetical protein